MFKIRNLSVGWGKMNRIMPKNGPFIIFLWILLLSDSMGEKNIVGDLSTPVGCDVAASNHVGPQIMEKLLNSF